MISYACSHSCPVGGILTEVWEPISTQSTENQHSDCITVSKPPKKSREIPNNHLTSPSCKCRPRNEVTFEICSLALHKCLFIGPSLWPFHSHNNLLNFSRPADDKLATEHLQAVLNKQSRHFTLATIAPKVLYTSRCVCVCFSWYVISSDIWGGLLS